MSRAFPNPGVVRKSIHRPPYAEAWLREDIVYERYSGITPEFLSQAYYSGRVLALREDPVGVMWFRPYNDDWPGLDMAARNGRISL